MIKILEIWYNVIKSYNQSNDRSDPIGTIKEFNLTTTPNKKTLI